MRQRVTSFETPSLFHEGLRRQEQERENRFLTALQEGVPQPVAHIARTVWDKIKGNVPGVLRAPLVDVMEEGRVLLTWDQSVHHLDVEISPDTSLDFFYLNRETNAAWDIEASSDESIPERVLHHFNFFRVLA
jgi:hypothetical protein